MMPQVPNWRVAAFMKEFGKKKSFLCEFDPRLTLFPTFSLFFVGNSKTGLCSAGAWGRDGG